MSASQVLGLSVVAALVTTVGSLLAMLLRETILVRRFERWKDDRAAGAILRRFRDPLGMAAQELSSRLTSIIEHYPPTYLTSAVLESSPSASAVNSDADPYFRKYRLVSSMYRLSAFLGWAELLRQELTFLDHGPDGEVETRTEEFRSWMADGHLNTARDWSTWRDALVFRDELRGIGDAVIVGGSDDRTVMGYREFRALYDGDLETPEMWWLRLLHDFMLDLAPDHDYREMRLRGMADAAAAVARELGVVGTTSPRERAAPAAA